MQFFIKGFNTGSQSEWEKKKNKYRDDYAITIDFRFTFTLNLICFNKTIIIVAVVMAVAELHLLIATQVAIFNDLNVNFGKKKEKKIIIFRKNAYTPLRAHKVSSMVCIRYFYVYTCDVMELGLPEGGSFLNNFFFFCYWRHVVRSFIYSFISTLHARRRGRENNSKCVIQ